MRLGLPLAVLTTSLFVGSAPAAAAPPDGKLGGSVVPLAYRLDLTILPKQTHFHGHVEIDVRAAGGERAVYLHGRALKVRKTQIRQGEQTHAARYAEVGKSGVARITLPRPLAAGEATLSFDYDAPFATGSAGLYRLEVAGEHYAWTQLEAVDARSVFPSFDEPGYKTPYKVSVTTAPGLLAVTNEAEIAQEPRGTLVKHTYAPTAPLPSYLIAFAVGRFDVLEGSVPATPQRKQPLPLRIIATRGQKDKLAYAMAQTKPIVQHLEAYFDRAFPFSKLDQIASPLMGGAMENAGAVIYDDTLLLLDEASPVRTKQAFGMVTSHELAHQWFGDLVTPAWWDDIWLNESFANWLGYRIAQQWNQDLNIGVGALEEALNAMNVDAARAGRPIRQPITRTGEIDSAFDPITYGKGGQVIAMTESYLGADKFQRGVRLHMQRFAGKSATSDDFFRALADAADDPRIVTSMRSFVDQQGVPVIAITRSKDGLTLRQKRYAALGVTDVPATTWSIPLCIRQGKKKQCALVDQPAATLALSGTGALVPNAGGHGYYRFSLSERDWDALIAAADSLTPAEALATIDSLWADFRAGGVGLPRLLQAARVFATQRDSNVAVASGEQLAALRSRGLIEQAVLPAYRKLIAGTYGPALQKLGFDPRTGAHAKDAPDTQALRAQLVTFLAGEAADPQVRDTLAGAAETWLSGDASALDRTYLAGGLSAWLTRAGTSGAGTLWKKLLASDDAFVRGRLLQAVARADSPDVARWALAHVGDPGLRSSEKLLLMHGMAQTPETRALGFAWLSKNFQKLARETNLSSVNMLFSLPSLFCSDPDAERIEQALRPQVKALGRGALPLDRAVERVRTCSALKRARGAEISEAVRAPHALEGS